MFAAVSLALLDPPSLGQLVVSVASPVEVLEDPFARETGVLPFDVGHS